MIKGVKTRSRIASSRAGRGVSMADVANRAGVSQQTVSRVANERPNVKKTTRARVLEAMSELGYRPNYAGRSLRGGVYQNVGLCMFDITRAGNLATLEGIASAARERGYAITMIEMGMNEPLSLTEASHRMAALPVDGMIFNMNRLTYDFEEFVPMPQMETVILTMYAHPRCSTIDSDQYGCSKLVMDHLMARGHREIRYIGGPQGSASASFREGGWHDALLMNDIMPAPSFEGDWTAESGYRAGCEIARDRAATAVYAANDQMAYGAMVALRERGRRIPADISVAGVDDSLVGVVPNVDLTTVRFDLRERGRSVFQCAIGANGASRNRTSIRLPGKLIERGSVADAR